MKEEFDSESIKNKAIEQLKAGKPLLGKDGAFAAPPRDRNSSFNLQFIKKRKTILAEGVADCIICLYALGNTTREIV